MSLKYSVTNALLCCVILLLAIENYETWNHSKKLLPGAGIVPKKSEARNENPAVTASIREPVSVQSCNLISEKNIFCSERKDFPILHPQMSKPVLRPQVILYGVTMFGDYQSASVVNPGRPLRKGERETMTLQLGERIGGYKLAKVLPDRIAMENDGDIFEVLLYDSKNLKRRMEARTETKPAMIASPRPAPVPPNGEAPKPTPSHESVERPKELAQAQAAPPLPFNKHMYQLLSPSGATRGGGTSHPTGVGLR